LISPSYWCASRCDCTCVTVSIVTDTTIKIDGHTVTVPQGKRIPQPQFSGSNFDKSEYLIYKESQHRIRYMLKLKF